MRQVNVNVNELRVGFSNTTRNPEGILSHDNRKSNDVPSQPRPCSAMCYLQAGCTVGHLRDLLSERIKHPSKQVMCLRAQRMCVH
jgi:hypothetical protein